MRYIVLLATLLILFSCDSDQPGIVKEPEPYNLDAPFYFGDPLIPADNQVTNEGVALGRMLFYEKRLSRDNSMSCASCHFQENAFASSNRFDEGVDGIEVKKNTMSLSNLLWSNRFFWNGRQATLEELPLEVIEHPIEFDQSLEVTVEKLSESAMYSEHFKSAFGSDEINPDRIGKALAQFMRTMISGESKYDKWLRDETEFTDSELRGHDLFFTHPDASVPIRGGNCGDCHSNFLTSGFNTGFDGFHNNGLDSDENLEEGLMRVTGNPADKGKFKAPTLRNIALTAPYMHDGRFNTLEEVLDHYNEHIQLSETLDPLILDASNEAIVPGGPVLLKLTDQEKEDIIAFLQTLTDQDFTTDEKFKNPFE